MSTETMTHDDAVGYLERIVEKIDRGAYALPGLDNLAQALRIVTKAAGASKPLLSRDEWEDALSMLDCRAQTVKGSGKLITRYLTIHAKVSEWFHSVEESFPQPLNQPGFSRKELQDFDKWRKFYWKRVKKWSADDVELTAKLDNMLEAKPE